MSKLAIGVATTTQGSTHADLFAIDLLEPGLVEILGSRSDRGRLGFSLGTDNGVCALAGTFGALALASACRRRRNICRHIRCGARVGGMLHARSGLQTGRDVLPAKGNLIEAVGESPVILAHERMDRLPNSSVSSQNLLKGGATQGRIRWHRQGVMKEFVVKASNDKEVYNLQHGQGSSKNTECTADRGLRGTARRDKGSGTREVLFTFKKMTQELAVRTGTTAVLPGQSVRLSGPQSPGNPNRVARGMSMLDSRQKFHRWHGIRREQLSSVALLESAAQGKDFSCSQLRGRNCRRRQGSCRHRGKAWQLQGGCHSKQAAQTCGLRQHQSGRVSRIQTKDVHDEGFLSIGRR